MRLSVVLNKTYVYNGEMFVMSLHIFSFQHYRSFLTLPIIVFTKHLKAQSLVSADHAFCDEWTELLFSHF